MDIYLQVLFFSLIGGLFSLIGGAIMLSRKTLAQRLANYATPFAAGALLAAAFFELLPESIEAITAPPALRWTLVGVVLFFLLEHFIHWFHHNHRHEDKHQSSAAPLIIIGDSVHNFIDGIAIGAAFLISVPAGIVVALAVAAHEIPQEIGDFGLLLKHGYKRERVLLINALSAVMSTLGALVTFWLGSQASLPVGELLAVTAGLFIYIASSDLIPEIHLQSVKKAPSYLAAALLLFGIVTVGVATDIAHEKLEDTPGLESSHAE
jgi:zinc and cadmium transporter